MVDKFAKVSTKKKLTKYSASERRERVVSLCLRPENVFDIVDIVDVFDPRFTLAV